MSSAPSGDSGIHVARIEPRQPRWLTPRWLLVAGAVAITLGFFSIFSVHASPPLIKFRQNMRWQSMTTLVPTWHSPPTSGCCPTHMPRTSPIAAYFAQLAASEPVFAIARRHGPLNGSYHADAVVSDGTHYPPPELRIEGVARTRTEANRIAHRITIALTTYVRHEQEGAGIPQSSRLKLMTVELRTTHTADRRFIVPLVTLAVVLMLLAVAGLSSVRTQRR